MSIQQIKSGVIADDAVTFDKLNDGSQLYGFRNRIINGGMQIWQRGTSSTSNGYSSADRYIVTNAATNTTITNSKQSDGPTGIPYCMEVKNTSAGTPDGESYVEFQQRIEADNAVDLNTADFFTISFYYKTNITAKLPLNMYHRTNANSNYRYYSGINIIGDETWRRATVTIPKNSVVASNPKVGNDWGLIMGLNLHLGTSFASDTNENTWINTGSVGGPNFGICSALNKYFRITGVQVEAGSVATPFERRPYGTELSLCQRYFQNHGNMFQCGQAYGTGVDGLTMNYSFPVSMRIAPTSTFSNGTDGQSLATLVVSNITTHKCTFEVRNTTGGGTSKWYKWDQVFSAEI